MELLAAAAAKLSNYGKMKGMQDYTISLIFEISI